VKSRTRKKQNPFLRLFLLGIILVSIVVGLMSLPVWKVTSVVVEGNRIVPKDRIKSAAGISNDENIFFIRYKEVARRIKQIPQIKKVSVSGHLPSTVQILVEERKA
jgi:cell division protein FtsQ